MFQNYEKQNTSKKHITKLNLHLQMKTDQNFFSQLNPIRQSSFTNSKKWNLFTPKISEKKYAFDFLMKKNSRLKSNTFKNTGLEYFLKQNHLERQKEFIDVEEEKSFFQSDLKPIKSKEELVKKDENTQAKIEETVNNLKTEENYIINPDEIYKLSRVNNYYFYYNLLNK